MDKQSKKRKIWLGIGISIVILALGAWILSSLHLISMEDILPFESTWHEEDATIHMDVLGIFDVVFHTQESVAYVVNERITMNDGVRIKEGRPYMSIRDLLLFNSRLNGAIAIIGEADTSDPVAVIVNGLYGQGTEEQNEMIQTLLGGEQARERFELYFQWYNTIHELGHLITVHHGTYDSTGFNPDYRHMVDEEQLVNSFAVAIWTHYGAEEKLDTLEDMVEYVLGNITPPVDDMSHIDFMRNAVDSGKFAEVFAFEAYGWFQFSIVRDALRERDSLDLGSLLTQMGVEDFEFQPRETLVYPALGTDKVPEVITDVRSVLRDSGVDIPDVYVSFNTDPNMHSLQYPWSRLILEPNIASGRLLPAYR